MRPALTTGFIRLGMALIIPQADPVPAVIRPSRLPPGSGMIASCA